jgi:hypothetical protein
MGKAIAICLVALAGCSNGQFRNQCTADSECSNGYKCILGRCGCASDSQCQNGQFCNSEGSCQTRIGCQTSLDCPMGEFCDTATGNCIDEAHCTRDVQCNLDFICDQTTFVCVQGCHDRGDCQLGEVCQCPGGGLLDIDAGIPNENSPSVTDGGTSDAGTPEATCSLGQCVMGPCADNSYCAYGQICVTDPSGGPNRCETDTAGPFCEPCQIEPGNAFGYCPGNPSNFCLVDTTKQFAADFCGVDCSTDPNSCPWGFECADVLVLTSSTCGSGFAGCPLEPNPVCSTDADCTSGGKCVVSSGSTTGTCHCQSDVDCPAGVCNMTSGQCQGQCFTNEGSVQGFCSCIRDSECPTDTCNSNGFCAITGKPCNPSVSSSCGPIFCKKVPDPQTGALTGYCYIGENCAPENGVTCDQVNQN